MNQVNCPVCGNKCIKAGKTKAGSQRWLCRKCNSSVTHKIDNSAKELQIFLDWLFGKESQSSMPGDGRTFRRKTAKYWNIWPMPPKVEDSRDVLYLDGIYLGRKACILICCDDKYVLGWYLCRYEYAAAWTALMNLEWLYLTVEQGLQRHSKKYGRVQNTKDAFSMYSAR